MSDYKWVFLIFVFCLTQLAVTISASDADVLRKFKASLPKDAQLNGWDYPNQIPPCRGKQANWFGVSCDDSGAGLGLQLESIGLVGIIDIDSLMELPMLRSLSVMNNSFDGPMPEVNKLTSLRNLYLSDNKFSGEIPEGGFSGMGSLKKLHFARNQFSGRLPVSLVKLPRLTELNVSGNRFVGKIPNFTQDGLLVMDFSNNKFEGKIPKSLSKMAALGFPGTKIKLVHPDETYTRSIIQLYQNT